MPSATPTVRSLVRSAALRGLVAVAALAAAALPATAAAEATGSTVELTHTITAAPGQEVRIGNLAGRVELVPVASGSVRVLATVHAGGRDAGETQQLLDGTRFALEKDKKGRAIWVLTYPVGRYDEFRYPAAFHEVEPGILASLAKHFGESQVTYRGHKVAVTARPSAPELWADLRVEVPRGANVAMVNAVGHVAGGALEADVLVDTGSGDVTIDAVTGRLSIDTGSGDVVVSKLRGDGTIDTGSGDVQVGAVEAGKLAIDTGSGDVEVRDGRVGELVADTGSGSIEVHGVELGRFSGDTGSGDVVVESSLAGTRELLVDTGSGDVRILAGPDAGFELAADQGSGDLSVGYGDAQLRYDGHEAVGATRGDRATKIRVSTGSGDCVVAPRT